MVVSLCGPNLRRFHGTVWWKELNGKHRTKTLKLMLEPKIVSHISIKAIADLIQFDFDGRSIRSV